MRKLLLYNTPVRSRPAGPGSAADNPDNAAILFDAFISAILWSGFPCPHGATVYIIHETSSPQRAACRNTCDTSNRHYIWGGMLISWGCYIVCYMSMGASVGEARVKTIACKKPVQETIHVRKLVDSTRVCPRFRVRE
jgi:hypothetical protein